MYHAPCTMYRVPCTLPHAPCPMHDASCTRLFRHCLRCLLLLLHIWNTHTGSGCLAGWVGWCVCGDMLKYVHSHTPAIPSCVPTEHAPPAATSTAPAGPATLHASGSRLQPVAPATLHTSGAREQTSGAREQAADLHSQSGDATIPPLSPPKMQCKYWIPV